MKSQRSRLIPAVKQNLLLAVVLSFGLMACSQSPSEDDSAKETATKKVATEEVAAEEVAAKKVTAIKVTADASNSTTVNTLVAFMKKMQHCDKLGKTKVIWHIPNSGVQLVIRPDDSGFCMLTVHYKDSDDGKFTPLPYDCDFSATDVERITTDNAFEQYEGYGEIAGSGIWLPSEATPIQNCIMQERQ